MEFTWYCNMNCCNFWITRGTIFVQGEICVSKYHFNPNIVVLQSFLGLHFIFYWLKKTSLFGTDRCKDHTLFIYLFYTIFLIKRLESTVTILPTLTHIFTKKCLQPCQSKWQNLAQHQCIWLTLLSLIILHWLWH